MEYSKNSPTWRNIYNKGIKITCFLSTWRSIYDNGIEITSFFRVIYVENKSVLLGKYIMKISACFFREIHIENKVIFLFVLYLQWYENLINSFNILG